MKRIKLTRGAYALVNDRDYDWLMKWKWQCHRTGYVTRSSKGRTIRMHREIMQPPDEMMVDHINHNKLDNRRNNLRIVTRSQNLMNSKRMATNTSGYKGVWWQEDKKKWRAQVMVDGKGKHVGYFDTPEEANIACRAIREELHGEYARHK